jgi:hypothetical protein
MRKIHTLSRLSSLLAMTFLWLCSPVAVAQQGTRVSIAVPSKVRPSDKLFKLVNDETLKQ